jgi:hypothetical protein
VDAEGEHPRDFLACERRSIGSHLTGSRRSRTLYVACVVRGCATTGESTLFRFLRGSVNAAPAVARADRPRQTKLIRALDVAVGAARSRLEAAAEIPMAPGCAWAGLLRSAWLGASATRTTRHDEARD